MKKFLETFIIYVGCFFMVVLFVCAFRNSVTKYEESKPVEVDEVSKSELNLSIYISSTTAFVDNVTTTTSTVTTTTTTTTASQTETTTITNTSTKNSSSKITTKTSATTSATTTKATTAKTTTKESTTSKTTTSSSADTNIIEVGTFKLTYYIPGSNQSSEGLRGGSGRKLIDCSTGTDVKGSVACKTVFDKYGYSYNGKRTMIYLEVPSMTCLNGYYYVDDCCARNGVIDIYYSRKSNCPFKDIGVIRGARCYLVKY